MMLANSISTASILVRARSRCLVTSSTGLLWTAADVALGRGNCLLPSGLVGELPTALLAWGCSLDWGELSRLGGLSMTAVLPRDLAGDNGRPPACSTPAAVMSGLMPHQVEMSVCLKPEGRW